jgi:hypothetical protein
MRGIGGILVVVVVCLAAVALYWFIGRSQLQKQIKASEGKLENLQAQLNELDRMEGEIPALLAKLPTWQRQYELFRAAIPSKIDDHLFLSAISDQLKVASAKFVSSELAAGGLWLDGVSDTQFEQLKAAGLDVDTAKQIKVAYYSLEISGDYQSVINAFEGLKRYGRLFTIDQVLGPAGGAAGNVVMNVDTVNTPIEMTGRIYYGIPENYFNINAVQRLFAEKGTGLAARRAADSIKSEGRHLLQRGGKTQADPAAAEDGKGKEATGSGLTAVAGEAG